MVTADTTEPESASFRSLIELSRAAVTRARKALARSQDLDRGRKARDAEMKSAFESTERLLQRLEYKVELARKLVASVPKGRRHI